MPVNDENVNVGRNLYTCGPVPARYRVETSTRVDPYLHDTEWKPLHVWTRTCTIPSKTMSKTEIIAVVIVNKRMPVNDENVNVGRNLYTCGPVPARYRGISSLIGQTLSVSMGHHNESDLRKNAWSETSWKNGMASTSNEDTKV
ncbi:hypothetical protein TNCV_3921411 [Trichonephila clavipes]|nr:hypothetical protein TNCV_3921411 [Trichonephila clavipes]